MRIKGIEHIGLAVDSIDTAAPFWRDVLQLTHRGSEEVKLQGVNTDIYDTSSGKVELLEGTNPDSPISKFLEKRGSGIHHICFEVDNVESAMTELKENNIQVIGDNPTIGAEGYKVIFIHPKSTGGVLVELAEKPLK
ncbi:MAG: methylmalonyl-CoA epimerase [Candidatus Marinimicrobia bacterium]|nr:methylmalonyl-CoA epimerase [Candidatus Neomarinimicrobiota bacterium]